VAEPSARSRVNGRTLLDAAEAAVFVAGDADGLVVESRTRVRVSRGAASTRHQGCRGVRPAGGVVRAARRPPSRLGRLPPRKLPGARMVVAWSAGCAGEPPRLVGTLPPAATPRGRAADILDLLSEMVCRWRPDGTVYYCNLAYARACGRERRRWSAPSSPTSPRPRS
jgi:PAS domain-containing protein